MPVKSVEAETSSRWSVVEVRRGVPVHVSPSSLDHGSKLRDLSPIAFVQLYALPPAYHRYEAKRPGVSRFLQCNRKEQITLTRFWSGHLRSLTSRDGNKVFPNCVRCSASQASPEYIFDCLGTLKQDLYEDTLIVLDYLKVNEIMDLI
ncbi:uncharacterized protein TNCV_891051 [Trichonephila clavipes]|nr:uncharacterized protein TNCV_891051 [Trichonephila clavipes]